MRIVIGCKAMAKEIRENKKETEDLPDDAGGGDEMRRGRRTPMRRDDTPVRDAVERFFDDRSWLDPLEFFRNAPRMFGRGAFPRVDVTETDKEIKVTADIPGVDPDRVDVEVRDNRLIISGVVEKEESEQDENARPYRYERTYGEFRREFTLPAQVKEGEAKATCKDGVLTIILPKIEVKKNKIKISREQ